MTDAVQPALATAGTSERADLAAWLAVVAGTLGAFMALLDISIVNAALPTIQGEIGATPSEGTWIGTSYLVAEIVVIPLTAWLDRMLGLRRLLLIAASMFTVFSMLCGLSTDLTTMIFGRIGQGLAGGTLIPTALTIIATRLPPSQQSIGTTFFGAAVLLGPVMGPLVGGWITENYSWHYAFFMNLPICIGLIILLMAGLPRIAGDWHELWNADWSGIAGMMIGLGSITVLLEEGHREQWFDSTLIRQLAVASMIGFIMIGWGQFRSGRPVIKLALLRNRGLATSSGLMLVMGAVLFSACFAIPQFLAIMAGYNAMQAGQVVFYSGLSSCLVMPFFPILTARVDVRIVVGTSALIVAVSSYLISGLTSQSVGSAFIFSQMLLGAGIALTALTLQQVAISSAPRENAGDASSLFVVSRNLGGSIGLASIASFQDRRLEFHHWQLHASLGGNDLALQQQLSEQAGRFGGGLEGWQAAYKALDAQVLIDALVMSFNDVFLTLALVTLIVTPFIIFLPPIKPGGTAAVMH